MSLAVVVLLTKGLSRLFRGVAQAGDTIGYLTHTKLFLGTTKDGAGLLLEGYF